jgi:phenylacetate-CoA ligase
LGDFSKIPILTKEQILKNPDGFVSRNLRSPIRRIQTSGSTGSPLRFYLSQAAAASANVSRIRALRWWGLELGDREVRVWTSYADLEPVFWTAIIEYWRIFFRDTLMNRRTFDVNKMTPQNMDKLWWFIKKYHPKYLFCYASFSNNFAKFVRERKYDGHSLDFKAIVNTAEISYDWQIQLKHDVFGCPVADEYGAVEVGVIGYSSPCGEIHLMDDFIVTEIIKSHPDNEFGEVVITQLENWGSPLIRYNLQDLAIPLEDTNPCPLGLGLSRIKSVLGRQHDLIRLSNGLIVHGQFFSVLMVQTPSVRLFQVIQKEPDFFEILVVTDGDEFPTDEEDFLKAKIHKYVGDVEIIITRVPDIPRETSGKFRFVRSEVN